VQYRLAAPVGVREGVVGGGWAQWRPLWAAMLFTFWKKSLTLIPLLWLVLFTRKETARGMVGVASTIYGTLRDAFIFQQISRISQPAKLPSTGKFPKQNGLVPQPPELRVSGEHGSHDAFIFSYWRVGSRTFAFTFDIGRGSRDKAALFDLKRNCERASNLKKGFKMPTSKTPEPSLPIITLISILFSAGFQKPQPEQAP